MRRTLFPILSALSICLLTNSGVAQAPNYIADVVVRNDCRFSTTSVFRNTTFNQSGTAAGPSAGKGTYTWTQSGDTSGGSVSTTSGAKADRIDNGGSESNLTCPQTIKIYAKNHGTHLITASGSASLTVTATPGAIVNQGEFSNYYPGQNSLIQGSAGASDNLSASPSGGSTIVASTKTGTCSNTSSTSYSGTTYYQIFSGTYGARARLSNTVSAGTSDVSGTLSLVPSPPSYQTPVVNIIGPTNLSGDPNATPVVGDQLQFTINAYDPDDGTTPGAGSCVSG